MIIQGTNIPIQLTFEQDVSGLTKLVATLWQSGKLLKQWERADMTIIGNVVTLPLNEDETRTWKKGKIKLEVKGLNRSNQVLFWEEAFTEVLSRDDRNVDLVD